MKFILPLILLPTLLSAQVYEKVDPVLSADYMEQVRKLRASIDPVDSINNSRNTIYKLKGPFTSSLPVTKVKLADGYAQLSRQYTRYLRVSGRYSGAMEVKAHNRLPALQSDYVQGRSSNSKTVWNGPETGEVFSFGPAVRSLEYDGSAYPYDQYGKLVATGTGNGQPASPYSNDIFRTAISRYHQLSLQGELFRYGRRTWNLDMKLGKSNDQNIIRENKENSSSFSTDIGTTFKWLTVKGTYMYNQQYRSNGNRNGLLNRAYQNAILSPVSFSNEQGTVIGDQQRSYSDKADNPWFLLRDNGNSYNQYSNNVALKTDMNVKRFRWGVTQSLLQIQEHHIEMYKPGTVAWPAGMLTDRSKKDRNYTLQSNTQYDIDYNSFNFKSNLQLNYTFNDATTRIAYAPDNKHYRYNRSAHDAQLKLYNIYEADHLWFIVSAANKLYVSNTARNANFFLPSLEMAIDADNILSRLGMRLSSSYHVTNSELAIDKSLAHINLLQYSSDQVFSYRPANEAAGFDGLKPITTREWSNKLSIWYSHFLLAADAYVRNINNDVFPVYNNGSLELENMADLQNKGIELSLSVSNIRISRDFGISNTISYFAFRNIVKRVNDGYNFTPIAGFSNVHKTLVTGEPVGVIVGNAWLRNSAGNIVVGEDGFPLVSPQPQVIGNPNPDFYIKFNNTLIWRRFTLQADLEWKKGGQVWNGTQAALDYYGRSAITGQQRHITNYVFEGVHEDGHVNTTPVAFYDVSQPVEKNRWSRYGSAGVAEAYIQQADHLKINTLSLAYRTEFKKIKQELLVSTYVSNILLWSPYKGADPDQLLYDQTNTAGLDFFNLPAVKTYGFKVSYQF